MNTPPYIKINKAQTSSDTKVEIRGESYSKTQPADTQSLTHHGYCERTNDQLLAEPINLITNVMFLIAAIIIWRRLRHGKFDFRQYWDCYLLSVVLISIAVGSTLWHSLATPWALYLDLATITLAINILLASSLIRVFKLSAFWSLTVFVIYQAANVSLILYFPANTLNGTVFYLATVVLITLMTITLYLHQHPSRHRYASSSALLIIAITIRGLDLTLCRIFPWGTHFLWHMLAACIFFLLITDLLQQHTTND